MVQINFALREVNCKIVYYGPGLSGKTTNLEVIHAKAPAEHRGELTSIATEGDRTLFFDFLPLDLGTVAGMKTKFQLYTVPGQVFYNSTRKLVLQGVDGIVFVADSRASKLEENLESLENLEENLQEYGLNLADIPHVMQYNKRDLPDIVPVEELEKHLNRYGAPSLEAAAVTGQGVFPTLKKLAAMVLESLNRQHTTAGARKRAAVSQKEPALVTVGGGEASEEAKAPAPGGAPSGGGSAREGVVAEKVAAGVKPVERRVPIQPKRVAKRSTPSQVKRTPQRRAPFGPRRLRKRRSRAAVWMAVAAGLLILTGAGVLLYVSGMLEGLLKRMGL